MSKSGAASRFITQDREIIDSDVHVRLPWDTVAEYADDRYKNTIKNNKTYPNSFGHLWDVNMGQKFVRDEEWNCSSVEDVQRFRKKFDIDYPILNPLVMIDRIPDSDITTALMRAINEAFVNELIRPDDDALGQIILSTHDPDAAAEEISRWGDEDKIVGALIANGGSYPPLGDPEYDIIYKTAEENDITITYHGGAVTGFDVEFPRQYHGLNSFPAVHVLAHGWQQQLTIASLISEGVPEKFPDLNFCHLEAGFLWVPDLMWRLNKEWSMRREEMPLCKKKPEEYIRDQFYFNSQPLGEPVNPSQLQHIIEVLGPESIMFGSDYPHWDTDMPIELGKHFKSYFSSDEMNMVFYESAAEAYGI